jgi:catechol 2,3-dioxygenase-like lactoylglutathione lyase family enzyme
MTLNHVHLGTTNIESFIEFYSRYFGFTKMSEHEKGAFLTNRMGFLIAVDPVNELPQLPEWYHLGFCLGSESEVFAMHKKMEEGKANIVRELRAEAGSYASFFVLDPDGNKLEVSWHND